jgi:hypothetical protein
MMTSYKATGIGDSLLEGLLSVALEETSSEAGMPGDEILGVVISAVKLANETPHNKASTTRLLLHVSQALEAAGWGKMLTERGDMKS